MKLFKFILALCIVFLTVIGALLLKVKIEKQSYKLEYQTQIQKQAQQYDLDPYLVAAIIHVESGNRPKAVSNAGAIGLMQIMPATGTWIAQKKKVDFKTKDLNDPNINISFGCWYLRFLQDRFEVKSTVIAAYNAGHNAVAKWTKDKTLSKDSQKLDDIPYGQTKHYVEKVEKAYEKYKKLYPKAFELY